MSKTYTTSQGDMWDSIAYSQLGDVRFTDLLIRQNMQYLFYYIFPAGITLVLPEVVTDETPDTLPPWKKKVNG